MTAALPRSASWSAKRTQKAMRRLSRVMTAPEPRLPSEPAKPPENACPTTWAVFMGCTTARRLSTEMGITMRVAFLRLNYAKSVGEIFNNGGRWQVRALCGAARRKL